MDEELLTSGEAATYLGITKQRVHELATRGKLEARRAGRFWLFRKAELDRWRESPKNKGGRPRVTEPQPEGEMHQGEEAQEREGDDSSHQAQ